MTVKYYVSIFTFACSNYLFYQEIYTVSFLDILRQRTRDFEVKKYCINILEKLGSFQYTREVLDSLDKAARAEVSNFGPNPIMENLLNDLLSWKNAEKSSDE